MLIDIMMKMKISFPYQKYVLGSSVTVNTAGIKEAYVCAAFQDYVFQLMAEMRALIGSLGKKVVHFPVLDHY